MTATTAPAPSRADLDLAFRRHLARRIAVIAAGLAVLLAAVVASASLGVESMGPWDTLRALLSPILPGGWYADIPGTQILVLQQLRLPRTAMAVVAGAGLSVAGVGLQGITRNPLVSPFTLGISWAAAFGASVAILLGLSEMPGLGAYWTVGGAFLSALVCAGLVLGFSAMRGVSSIMLILAGVGLTYLFNALTATIQFVATEQQLAAIVQWTFGSLNGSTWGEVAIAGGILVASMPVLLGQSWALNAFAAGGDEVAQGLGFAVGRTRVSVTVATVLMTAGIVSFTGVIGFVGLVAPHIARMLIGGDHRTLTPFAAIVGAVLLLVSDMIGRLAFAPVIIPVGIVVAYIGVPLFLHLLLTRRQELMS